MKKLFPLFIVALLLPSFAFAYTSSDIAPPVGNGKFTDGGTFFGGFTEGIHLVSDRSDWCVTTLGITPWQGHGGGFSYSGGYLLYKTTGELLDISTTTIAGKDVFNSTGVFNASGHDTWSFNAGTDASWNKVYCTSQAQFTSALGIVVGSDPPVKLWYMWDTPTNQCRTNNLTLTQCRAAGAMGSNYQYGYYDYTDLYGYGNTLHFETPNFGGSAIAFLSLEQATNKFKATHIESPDFKVGVTTSNLASWMMGQLLLVMGSGLGLLLTLWPYLLALAAISLIISFLWSAFMFFKGPR